MNFTPYRRYTDYIRETYNCRVQKITVDAGLTCPNRDGSLSTKGCIYCNNESFAPVHLRNLSLTEQIDHGITTSKRRYNVDKFFIYFQPYSNTYAPLEKLKILYEEALSHPKVVGLCIGTRPDCVDKEKIDYLQTLAKQYDITIEYGLESISDQTLKRINRGHNYQCFIDALEMTINRGIKICVHLILGFPWENKANWIKSAQVLSNLPINFIKLHQLHLVKDTALAEEYLKKPFPLLNRDQYVDILIDFLENLNPDIVIQRVFGDAPPNLTISPSWNIETGQFSKLLENTMNKKNSFQGKLFLSNKN